MSESFDLDKHAEPHDPNRDLEPFVIGMVAGALPWPRLEHLADLIGWRIKQTSVDGKHAIVFTSPSGIKWRIRAEIIDRDDDDDAKG